MAIWDPWKEISRIEREMRRLFDEFWGSEEKGLRRLPLPKRAGVPAEREELVGTPPVDLIDKEDSLVLKSEMPGVRKEDIKVSVTDEEISLSGKVERKKEEKEENYYYSERAYNAWRRIIPLPVRIQSDKAKAKYENGLLEITLPKAEEAKAKRKELKVD